MIDVIHPLLETVSACLTVCAEEAHDMCGLETVLQPVEADDHLIVTLTTGQRVKLTAEVLP